MDAIKEFMPRKTHAQVGEHTLVVREFVAAKRDAVLNLLLGELDLTNAVKPAIEAFKDADGDGDEVTADGAGLMLDLVRKVIGSALTKISCLVLDVPENRKVCVSDEEATKIVVDDHGVKHCPAMFEWVADNITPRQEVAMLEAVFEVNDFAALVKNYVALVSKALVSTANEGNSENEG